MARKKKHKKRKKKEFGAVEQIRLRARESIGMPRPAHALSDKRRKPPRHKKDLIERELDALDVSTTN